MTCNLLPIFRSAGYVGEFAFATVDGRSTRGISRLTHSLSLIPASLLRLFLGLLALIVLLGTTFKHSLFWVAVGQVICRVNFTALRRFIDGALPFVC